MIEKQHNWHKIGESVRSFEFSADCIATVEVQGKKLCIIHHQEKLFACSAKCPHAGGAMAQGYIDALGNIVCPVHRYKFSLQNGRNTSGEGYFLRTYPVEIRENGVFVGL